MARIGLISDTHGLLRPQAVAFLRGSDLIIHGGDIGKDAILTQLRAIAPMVAVRGNNDRERWADALHETEAVEIGGSRIYVVHDISKLDIDPAGCGFQVVISGHSHKAQVKTVDGVLYVNPGSAGPRRFKLPVSVAELIVTGESREAHVVELDAAKSARKS